MKKYKDIINWLFKKCNFRSNNKLFRKVYNYILDDNIVNDLRIIHITGTNGKGSVSYMLNCILLRCKYKVGLFTSPHLLDYRERIKVNSEMIEKEFICNFFNKYYFFFIKYNLSFFEITTLLALKYFKKKKVNIVILEVGIGGRYDATNIIKNTILSIITNINIDHTNILGNSLKKIAYDKIGIIKSNVPCVIGKIINKNIINLIKKYSNKIKSNLYFIDLYKKDIILNKNDIPYYQIINQKIAILSSKILNKFYGLSINNFNISMGINDFFNDKKKKIFGRWTIINKYPKVICDIAHNPHAFKYINKELIKEKSKIIHIIIGFTKYKDINGILNNITVKNVNYYFCTPNTHNKLSINKLICKLNILNKNNYYYFSNPIRAYNFVIKKIKINDLILITGSNYIVSEFFKKL